MNKLKNESGQALVLVMMIIMVVLLMSSSLLTQGSESRKASFEERKIVQAYYIAEAGAEKALAEVKNNPLWLKGLTLNTSYTFISNLSYASGQITSVTVKRTTNSANPTLFFLESVGEYQGAKRTIQVQGEMYDPVNFPIGVWVNSALSQFSQNSLMYSDVTVNGDIVLENNCNFYGNLTALGNVTLKQNTDATSIRASGNVNILNNAFVTLDIHAGGDVNLANNTRVNGVVNAIRDVTVGSGAMIGYEAQEDGVTVFHGKDVYYNGNIVNNGQTGPQHHGSAEAVNISIPPFPTLEQSWYADSADQILTGNLSGTFSINGVYYAPGDISISGTYSGVGAIVAGGKVTINGNLNRANTDSSLSIISFGSPVGIEVINNLTSVYALMFSPNKIIIGNGSQVQGSVICNIADILQNAVVIENDLLQNKQPQWITSVVKITSWKEKYSVF